MFIFIISFSDELVPIPVVGVEGATPNTNGEHFEQIKEADL